MSGSAELTPSVPSSPIRGLVRMDKPIGDLVPEVGKASPIPTVDSDQLALPSTAPRVSPAENIDLSQAIVNPDSLSEPSLVTENRPIWERENAERFASSPGIDRYVIWSYKPGDEGVIEYPRFDSFDPLPHHLYKSQKEYDRARGIYQHGGLPDKIVDVRSMPSWGKSLSKPANSGQATVAEPTPIDSTQRELEKAA